MLDPITPETYCRPRAERPFRTIIPAFIEQGDVRIGFGVIGRTNTSLSAHAQFVSNLVDFIE